MRDGVDRVEPKATYQVCPMHDELGPNRTLNQHEHLCVVARIDRNGDVETI